MKLLLDEGLSPKLIHLLVDLFPDSESALQNGLAGRGDTTILEHAIANGFVLVTTDADFASLAASSPNARIVILQACNYPTAIAAKVLRKNSIRIATLQNSRDRLLILNR